MLWYHFAAVKYGFTLIEGERREKFVLESRGDLPRHVVLKLLAYILWRDASECAGQPLEIEKRVGQRHKPDLVATEPLTESVRLWIDCGQIETARLGRIAAKNPGARIIVLKGSHSEVRSYSHAALAALPEPCRARVEVWGVDEPLLLNLIEGLRGANTLQVIERAPDALEIQMGETGPRRAALCSVVLKAGLPTASGTAADAPASSPRFP
jgi:uncharacterized protein YaeQ